MLIQCVCWHYGRLLSALPGTPKQIFPTRIPSGSRESINLVPHSRFPSCNSLCNYTCTTTPNRKYPRLRVQNRVKRKLTGIFCIVCLFGDWMTPLLGRCWGYMANQRITFAGLPTKVFLLLPTLAVDVSCLFEYFPWNVQCSPEICWSVKFSVLFFTCWSSRSAKAKLTGADSTDFAQRRKHFAASFSLFVLVA